MNRRIGLFFLLAIACLILPVGTTWAAPKAEYIYLATDLDGNLLHNSAPDDYKRLRKAIASVAQIKIIGIESLKKALDKAGIKAIPSLFSDLSMKKLADQLETEYLIVQTSRGRPDAGSVTIWVMEKGKVEVSGRKLEFAEDRKPPMGLMDTMLLDALSAFDFEDYAKTLLEAEKFGDMGVIMDSYYRYDSMGAHFARLDYLSALRAVQDRNMGTAETLARKAISIDPHWPPYYELLSKVIEKGESEEHLRKQLEKRLELHPDNLGMTVLYASLLDPEKDGEQIAAAIKRAKRINPDNPTLVKVEIRLALAQDRDTEVPTLIDRLFEVDLSSKEQRTITLNVADILYQKRRFEEAAMVYAILLSHSPQASIYSKKAKCHEMMGDIEGMRSSLIKAFLELPEPNLGHRIVLASRDLNKTKDAVAEIAGALEQNQDDWLIPFVLGKLYLVAGQYQQALDSFEQASKLNNQSEQPDFLHFVTKLATLQTEEEVQQAFVEYYANHTAVPKGDVGLALLEYGHPDKAVNYLLESTKESEPKFSHLYGLAIAGMLTDNKGAAKKGMKLADQLESRNPERWMLLLAGYGTTFNHKKSVERALDAARSARIDSQSRVTLVDSEAGLLRYKLLPRQRAAEKPPAYDLAPFLDFADGIINLQELNKRVLPSPTN